MSSIYDNETIARFWAKVEKTDACWHWTAAKDSKGYGIFQFQGKPHKAHRVAYELTYGPIPAGLFVCHHCDNPSCVRPDHLFLGTVQDNNRDRDQKGRNNPVRGDAHWARRHPERNPWLGGDHQRGERNNHAKITQEQAEQIRIRYATERTPLHQIASEYGISFYTANKIIRYEIWNSENEQSPISRPANIRSYLRSGERSARAKLSQRTVDEIRARFKAGGTTKKQLAHEYRVGESTIGRITRNESYRSE